MIVQVIQLDIDPTSRSRTLQRAMRAIDDAANLDPAPDLIALPAFGNALSALNGAQASYERAPGMVTASCGLRGRSWGVFLTVGLAEKGASDKPYLTGMLLDRDADIRILQRMTTPTKKPFKSAFAAHENRIKIGTCLLGQFALLVGDDICNEACWQAASDGSAQAVIGTTCWTSDCDNCDPAALAGLAKKFSMPCLVADCTTGKAKSKPALIGCSCIVSASGEILAAAEPMEACSLQAELELPEPKATPKETVNDND